MLRKYIFSSIIILLIACSGCQTTFYVVRHAEKASEPAANPSLTDKGEVRAENLAEVLKKKRIEEIYSSNYRRTIETVRPTSESKYIDIEFYDPADQDAFIEQLKKSQKNTLISGHSNTIRYIINGLYESEVIPKDLEDQEYGDLFVIKRSKSGKPTSFEKLKY